MTGTLLKLIVEKYARGHKLAYFDRKCQIAMLVSTFFYFITFSLQKKSQLKIILKFSSSTGCFIVGIKLWPLSFIKGLVIKLGAPKT